ncbi:MAG: hypothetical protein Q4A17_07115 [Thermoguttaceae bacterium]|nr:hypothetical protein [Thermoguttaceae bacterium]
MKRIFAFFLAFLLVPQFLFGQESPLIPMGAITGRPTEADVVRTLEAYKAVGIDQFLIYARSGLEYEYMGEEWLQMTEQFCRHARRLGMKIWLYDEYNWPSGSCKGKVRDASPDFQYREYQVFRNEDGSFRWEIGHLTDFGADNYSFEAMKYFMETTHHVYEKRFREYMGNTIVGIFTDEPAHKGHIPVEGQQPALRFRYCDQLDEEYAAKTGRGFRTDVEEFLNDPKKNDVWVVYTELLGERFRKAFFDPIREWCDRMGIFFTGHMISENSSIGSAQSNGLPLWVLKGLSLPGMDEISTRVGEDSEWLTLGVAQHAAGRVGNGGLAELFALGPADQTFGMYRQMLWLEAFHKVDHYVLAIAALDGRGFDEKHGYCSLFTPVEPWFGKLGLLNEAAREAAAYAKKPFKCPIAVRYPQREAGRTAYGKNQKELPLRAFLCALSLSQLTWDLYEEKEACDKPVIFDFDLKTGEIVEERSGKRFATVEEATVWAKAQMDPADGFVVNADRTPAQNVLVRRYEDGEIVVLNLQPGDRTGLKLQFGNGKEMAVNLPSRGVFFSKKAAQQWVPKTHEQKLDVQEYAISLDSPNRRRVFFGENGEASVVLTEPQTVRFAVRNYPVPFPVRCDGKPISGSGPADVLPQGFDSLYAQSEPVRLEAGRHSFQLDGMQDSNLFLPALWIVGNFGVEEPDSLVPQTRTVKTSQPRGRLSDCGLRDYVGEVRYTAEVTVPVGEGPLWLRMNPGACVTNVKLGGLDLGTLAWMPYEWAVPEELRGKTVTLEITLWTSIQPMFGDYQRPGTVLEKFWIPPRATDWCAGLFEFPKWVW